MKRENVVTWWGDEEATLAYLREALASESTAWGGDPQAVFFAGFSRGAIAGGYLGLRNDEVAKLWRGFILHSHIDGGRFTPDGARERLARAGGRPTFITYGSDDDGRRESPKGAAILRGLGSPVVERQVAGLAHTDRFLDVDTSIRREMRAWLAAVLAEPSKPR
jgi:predicted esterase